MAIKMFRFRQITDSTLGEPLIELLIRSMLIHLSLMTSSKSDVTEVKRYKN